MLLIKETIKKILKQREVNFNPCLAAGFKPAVPLYCSIGRQVLNRQLGTP